MRIRMMGLVCLIFVSAVFVSSCYEDDSYGELLTYESEETTDMLEIDLDIRHIEIIMTDEDFITLTYHEHEDDTWQISETDGTMTVKQNRKTTFKFFQFGTADDELVQLEVYLPKSFNGSMDLFTAVGRIEIDPAELLNIESLDVHTNVGQVKLENIVITDDLTIDSSTGDISVESVAADTVEISVSTGKVTLEDVQTGDLDIRSSTGSVKVINGTITGDLDVENSTGDIVISNTTARAFDLRSSTGSITMTVFDDSEFSFDLETTLGDVTVFGTDQGRRHVDTDGDVPIKARVSTGSITIRRDA